MADTTEQLSKPVVSAVLEGTTSFVVSIHVDVEKRGSNCTIIARALWEHNGTVEARSVREISLDKANAVKDVSPEEFIEATKRDALRELVTQLNLHGGAVMPKQVCCKPTEEELRLIQEGDYCAEELWGGSRPTCPNCINEVEGADED